MQYKKQLQQYLAYLIYKEIYEITEWPCNDLTIINKLIKETENKLSREEIKIAKSRAMRIYNSYHQYMLDYLQGLYWDEFDKYEQDNEYNFYAQIDYNEQFYNIWKSGVAKRQTIKLKYESLSSGLTERLVDPYCSNAPYGEGYCHKRMEVRKFRFDRVIDIELTEKKFTKPLNWKK